MDILLLSIPTCDDYALGSGSIGEVCGLTHSMLFPKLGVQGPRNRRGAVCIFVTPPRLIRIPNPIFRRPFQPFIHIHYSDQVFISKVFTLNMLPADSFSLTGSGAWIPSRGIGTFLPDPSLYGPGSVKQAVLQALSAGYRHIDTALRYDNGLGEREVGEAVRESGILRREIFIVTKLLVGQ